jgi:hypothetical protein
METRKRKGEKERESERAEGGKEERIREGGLEGRVDLTIRNGRGIRASVSDNEKDSGILSRDCRI